MHPGRCARPQALAQCHELALGTTCPTGAPPVGEQRRRRAPRRLDPAVAGIASVRAASSAWTVVAHGDPDDAFNRTASRRHPRTLPGAQAFGPRLREPGGLGEEPAGAVHDMLVPLKTHGVSMTRFESRPARSGQWEYFFYIDIEGHPTMPAWRGAGRTANLCAFFKVWGPTR